MHRNENGFTFVEVVVIAPIVILIIGAFLAVIVSMTSEVLVSHAKNSLAANIQFTLNMIEDDVRVSNAFLATNNMTVTSPQGVNNDATAFVNADQTKGDALILGQTATITNPVAPPTSYVYRKDQPNACNSPFLRLNSPIEVNNVYFVKDTTLWRRTIMPSDYASTGCVVPWQQPTCQPGFTAVFCKTEDSSLVDGVTSTNFIVTYYDDVGATIANNTAGDPTALLSDRSTALESVTTVQVSISAAKTIAAKEISWSGTRRIVLP